MSISKKWQRRAWETWREMPPKKTVRRSSHLKFSKTMTFVSVLQITSRHGMILTGSEQAFLRESISENSQCDVAEGTEYDDEGEVDFERIQVVVIKIPVEPADQEVIC
jgi:hypothetical protein